MAIRLFVAIPPKYGMTQEEIVSQIIPRYEELAHKAEELLGKYCELYYTLDGLMRGNIEAGKKEYMSDCLMELKDADYAVFADNWKLSDECLRLCKIAEALNIPVLDMTEMEGNSYEKSFCGSSAEIRS